MESKGNTVFSPIPQRPASPRVDLTTEKIEWLYNCLAVLHREDSRLGVEKDSMRVSLLRKRLVERAAEESR